MLSQNIPSQNKKTRSRRRDYQQGPDDPENWTLQLNGCSECKKTKREMPCWVPKPGYKFRGVDSTACFRCQMQNNVCSTIRVVRALNNQALVLPVPAGVPQAAAGVPGVAPVVTQSAPGVTQAAPASSDSNPMFLTDGDGEEDDESTTSGEIWAGESNPSGGNIFYQSLAKLPVYDFNKGFSNNGFENKNELIVPLVNASGGPVAEAPVGSAGGPIAAHDGSLVTSATETAPQFAAADDMFDGLDIFDDAGPPSEKECYTQYYDDRGDRRILVGKVPVNRLAKLEGDIPALKEDPSNHIVVLGYDGEYRVFKQVT